MNSIKVIIDILELLSVTSAIPELLGEERLSNIQTDLTISAIFKKTELDESGYRVSPLSKYFMPTVWLTTGILSFSPLVGLLAYRNGVLENDYSYFLLQVFDYLPDDSPFLNATILSILIVILCCLLAPAIALLLRSLLHLFIAIARRTTLSRSLLYFGFLCFLIGSGIKFYCDFSGISI